MSGKQIQWESQEQMALMTWCEWHKDIYPELEWIHHIPNGGRRDKTTGARLKKEGVKAGVPDLCLPVPMRGYHGLYIEMKQIAGGSVSPNQKRWLKHLNDSGYYAVIAHGWREAAEIIKKYLGKRGIEDEQSDLDW